MDSLQDRLAELESQSAVLDPLPADRRAGHELAGRHVEQFLDGLPGLPIYAPASARDDALAAFAIDAEPSGLPAALDVVREHVDGIGHNLGSSRFFAYIPSGGLFESALADYIASASNRYVGVGAAAPGATRLEETMIRWLAGVVGYPPTAEGDLTSGGSIAALSAIVAAREALKIRSDVVRSSVVYLTAHTHHTFRKALHVAGLGDCVVREVDVDAARRMRPASLERQIAADRDAGLRPWLIGATAGTTDTGAVDPLPALADIADEAGLWLHVDAAYGGAFALSATGRAQLAGIERSHSLIIDPHKGFFLPGGTGVVLVRDGRKLYDAYHARGVYMQDVAGDTERSPCDYSAELTRPFRALRFWLPLKVHGSAVFAAALEEKLLLARYFHEQLADIPGIDPGPAPDLSIVTFRVDAGDAGDDDGDEATRALLAAIHDDGRVFMTSTTIDGRFTIRLAVLGHKTHLADVVVARDVIRELMPRCIRTTESAAAQS